MKNILNPADREAILARIDKVRPDSPAQWGKMNASEMICHCADQLRLAFGEIPTQNRSSFPSRTIFKTLVLWGMPAPKGKVPTAPEIDQATKSGTRPVDFGKDLSTLKKIIAEFVATSPGFAFADHPVFGRLNNRQWGRLIYVHLDHHLKQFSA